MDGLRVVDCTQGLAGHFCTMLLGDQGAEVIKVEPVDGGDPSRADEHGRVGGESLAFLSANRNKLSVALDPSLPVDAESLRQLVATADVFVGTMAPDEAERAGLAWSQLSPVNPRLVYCSISGRGEDGPGARSPSTAVTAEAEGGLMSVTGEADGPPVTMGVPMIENLTGLFAKDAITAALLARERTGRGQKIETSLLEVTVAILGMPAAAYLMTGLVAGRWGAEHQWHVPWKTFATLDGHVVIASSSEDQWAKICLGIQRPDLATDPRFATMQLRAQHRRELYGILDPVLAARTTEWWLTELADAGAAAAPVNTMDRVFADVQVLHRNMVQQVKHTTLGWIPQVGHAQKFSRTPAEIRLPPPTLGEHTVAVLEQLPTTVRGT